MSWIALLIVLLAVSGSGFYGARAIGLDLSVIVIILLAVWAFGGFVGYHAAWFRTN